MPGMSLVVDTSQDVDHRSYAWSVAETVLLAVWHYQSSDDAWAGDRWSTDRPPPRLDVSASHRQ